MGTPLDALREAAAKALLSRITLGEVTSSDLIKLLAIQDKNTDLGPSGFDFNIILRDD